MSKIRMLNCGDTGVLLEFGAGISQKINQKVWTFFSILEEECIAGIIEAVPGFRTLLIEYDPLITNIGMLRKEVKRIEEAIESIELRPYWRSNTVTIPIVFGGEFGPDLDFIAQFHRMEKERVIDLFLKADYTVYMFAFVPFYPLLARLPRRLATPRLKEPRLKVPIGTVGIGNVQVAIYTMELPGGMQLIGRTPLKIYEPMRKASPSLLGIGDTVRFKKISEKEYMEITQRLEGGEVDLNDFVVGG